MDIVLILKNIIIEAEKLAKIIKEIKNSYGETVSEEYKNHIFNLFLKVSYLTGIADDKFVYEEKIVIQYYFWRILDETKIDEIEKLKKILDNEETFLTEYENIKKESDIFFKSRIEPLEKEEQISIDNLKELEKIKEIDMTNSSLIYNKIISSLYRFASYIVKADGEIHEKEIKYLKDLWLKIFYINNKEIKPRIASNQILKYVTNLTSIHLTQLEEHIEELNKLIGLKSVKQEILALINFLKVKKLREEQNLPTSDISLHLVFLGNPGTGKTMIARLLGAIYKDIGILKSGHVVEADRSKFVADFIGQTSSKTDKLIESALDGILFIDEAYSLISPKTPNDFGHEAVSILLKRMEDYRNRFIVICAGYPEEMKKFLEENPGLKSRFNKYLEFPDYSPEELVQIFQFFCNKLEYVLTNEAEQKVLNIMREEYNKRDKYFGNARFARNLFEATMKNHANRIAEIAPITKEILTYIRAIDVPDKIERV